ncbi:MAG: lysostaphin resistance A-like protein [Bulleidia sp.]
MREFQKKHELWFALMWIIIYVVVMGNLRNTFGDEGVYTLAGLSVLTVVFTVYIVRNGLCQTYGLTRCTNSRRYLYYLPLVVLCTVNLWFGLSMHYDPIHQCTAVMTMILVGYLEEVIFRGLLFRAIEKDSVKQAVIISALTFGAGHIVNLLTGHGCLETIRQMIYAAAIGFAFVLLFYRSGSLVPCIITHCVIDVTSKFSNQNIPSHMQEYWSYGATVLIVVVAGAYALYLYRLTSDQS